MRMRSSIRRRTLTRCCWSETGTGVGEVAEADVDVVATVRADDGAAGAGRVAEQADRAGALCCARRSSTATNAVWLAKSRFGSSGAIRPQPTAYRPSNANGPCEPGEALARSHDLARALRRALGERGRRGGRRAVVLPARRSRSCCPRAPLLLRHAGGEQQRRVQGDDGPAVRCAGVSRFDVDRQAMDRNGIGHLMNNLMHEEERWAPKIDARAPAPGGVAGSCWNCWRRPARRALLRRALLVPKPRLTTSASCCSAPLLS